MRGQFITIEGTEGAGKSTAMKAIARFLRAKNIDLVLTREPGGTPFAEEIRQLLLKPRDEKIHANTELLLMFAARAQHLAEVILPALQQCKWVISDRYIDASYAYQGGGRGLSLQTIKTLDQLVAVNHYPDLTLLLDIDAAQGMARTHKRMQGKDRIEQEHMTFFNTVRQHYLTRAAADPERIKIIDASQSFNTVEQQILHQLQVFIEKVQTA